MAQYQITLDSKLFHQLFLGNSRDEAVATLLESILNQVLKLWDRILEIHGQ